MKIEECFVIKGLFIIEMSLNIIILGVYMYVYDSNCEIINILCDLNFVDFVGIFYYWLYYF